MSLIDLFIILIAALIYVLSGKFSLGLVLIVTLIVLIVVRLLLGERFPSRAP